MNELIQSLLEEAPNHDAETGDFTEWSNRALAEFPVKPYDALHSFKVERFDYPEDRGHDYRLKAHKPVAEETVSLAHYAWRALGGDQDPARGICCAAMASIEYVRAQLHTVLWIGSRLNVYRTYRPEVVPRIINSVLAIDWHDSQAVLGSNFQVYSCLGVRESLAETLYSWTATTGRPENTLKDLVHHFPDVDITTLTTQEIMCGAALLAIDTASASSDLQHSIGLMSFAANSTWQAGFDSGWAARDEALRDDAKHAGKKGGTQRHQASRELKAWALAEAATLQGSDMYIARKLTQQIPPLLRDASADPERLIYDALRSTRKNTRQGG